MRLGDLVYLSLHNLLLHKARSLLTSLGVIFGVGSVIAMLGISAGAKKKALDQIGSLGIDNIILYAKELDKFSNKDSNENIKTYIKSYGLTDSDRANILAMDNITRISNARDARISILKGINRTNIDLFWVSQDFAQDVKCQVTQGRWFTPPDYREAQKVCVIGKNVKRRLFGIGEKEILGRTIKAGNILFQIVGVLENIKGTKLESVDSLNDSIYIPEETGLSFFSKFKGSTHVDHDLFVVKVKSLAHIDNTAKRIRSLLEKSDPKKDWGITVPIQLLKQAEATQNLFTLVMGSIAGISLLVGGIGIMNIMLANVYERRKEIGTRRAIGAQKKDILLQFLVETVFLTMIGGGLGIGLGIGLTALITHFSGMPAVISPWSIIGSIAVSTIVGIVFGTYPAWQAANQNPIEALKAE